MGADGLDQGLAPFAEVLLIIIVMIMVAGAASYVLNKYVQRRKEKAHNQLSKSRRVGDTKIDLFARADGDQVEQSAPPRKSKSHSSRFSLLQGLKDLAFKLDASKGSSRGRRSKGSRRRSSNSASSRIDILVKSGDASEASAPPPDNTPPTRANRE